jgi:hypothetical protein
MALKKRELAHKSNTKKIALRSHLLKFSHIILCILVKITRVCNGSFFFENEEENATIFKILYEYLKVYIKKK